MTAVVPDEKCLVRVKKYFLDVKNAAGYHPVPVIPFIQMEPYCRASTLYQQMSRC